ncbi:hypothetical protein D9M71_401420 [compost metagenome]
MLPALQTCKLGDAQHHFRLFFFKAGFEFSQVEAKSRDAGYSRNDRHREDLLMQYFLQDQANSSIRDTPSD